MYRIAKARLNNEDDICDVIQDTFISAYKNISKLKNVKYFKTWLIKILINKCNDFYKSSEDIVSFNNINLENSILQSTNEHSNMDFLDLICELNYDERTIIILYYSDNYTIKEISKILNISYETTKSKLKRARKKIANKLYKENM